MAQLVLVRPLNARIVIFLAAVSVAACAQTQIEGAHVTGVFTAIHADEVRAAMRAADTARPRQRGQIYEVHVVSNTEMHIYREPKTHLVSYQIARKIAGRWNADERAIIVND